jgi:hypothetical protein
MPAAIDASVVAAHDPDGPEPTRRWKRVAAVAASRGRATSRPSTAGWPRTGLNIRRNARRRRAVLVFWDESGALLGGGNAATPGTAATLEADRRHSSRPFGRGTPARGYANLAESCPADTCGFFPHAVYRRLEQVKGEVDSGNLFRTNHPILSPIS